ncbi:TPA: hypothetical protein DDZ86_00475 [Candidatus Dependentiae bacterium]|nr:MAG: hypothetical protein UW09_C0002G0028 [candidate division TM6 bacterium GW2011_GWF2_43_87]HBL98104.1 hypothetical protein [Candidatus Dependentiae bacterium]
MKKTSYKVILSAGFLAVWVSQADAKLEKNSVPFNISNQSNQQSAPSVQQNMRTRQRQLLMQGVANALLGRWTLEQRALISNINVQETDSDSVVISPTISQNSNISAFQNNFFSFVTAIVNSLQGVMVNREFSFERLGVQNSQDGIVFRPIFLQDSFDSDEDEEMPEVVNSEEEDLNFEEEDIDSPDEEDDEQDGQQNNQNSSFEPAPER